MSTFRSLILIATLALILCPIASYAKTDEASMLQQAREQYQEGNYYFASTWIERVLKDYPAMAKREELLLMLLKSYTSTGRTAKAIAVVNTLRQEYPKTADTLDSETLKKAGYTPPPQYDLAEIADPPTAPEAAAQAPAPTSAAADGKAAASTPAAQPALSSVPAGPAPNEAKASVPAEISPPPPPPRTPTMAEIIRAIKADQAVKAAAAPPPPPVPAPAAAPSVKEVPKTAAPAAAPSVKEVPKTAAPAAAPSVKEVPKTAAPAAVPVVKEVAKSAAPAAVPVVKEATKKGAPTEPSVAPALPRPAPAAPAAVPVVKEVTKAAAPAAVPAAKDVAKAAVQPQAAVPPAVSKPTIVATVTRPVSKEVTTSAPAATVPAPPPVAALPAHTAGKATPKPASEPLRQPEAPVAPGNPRKAPAVSYTLQIGEYVVKSTMVEVKGKLVHAGLEPVVEQGPKKKEPMVRLYVGEFPNQAAAKNEVQKLRALKVEGFFLVGADGKCQVYAGSYADEKGATRELQRIAALGRKFTLKPVTVAVPTFMLTAGTFPTRSEAQHKAQELEKQGVKAVVIEHVAPERTNSAEDRDERDSGDAQMMPK